MKLISMKDFVLEQSERDSMRIYLPEGAPDPAHRFYREVSSYANFLNRPLTIGMFKGKEPLFITGECEVLMITLIT